MATLISQSYSKKLLRLISWSHWFTFFNIWVAIVLSSIYLFADPLPETLFGRVYLVTNWVSHMAFLTFVSFVLIVFPITLLFPVTRFIRGFASFVFTIVLTLLVLDGFIYQSLGYHLSSSSTSQIIDLLHSQIQRDSRSFWAACIVIAGLILAFELVVSNYAWRHIQRLQQLVFAKYFVASLVVAFIFSHVAHIWADAKLNYDILQQDNTLPISYPSTAKALLAKYDLFDRSVYQESQTKVLGFNDPIPAYPVITNDCAMADAKNVNMFMILTKKQLTANQVALMSQRASANRVRLSHYVDSAATEQAWFNMFYSLPNIYHDDILAQQTQPVLFQLMQRLNIDRKLTLVTTPNNPASELIPTWVAKLFNNQETISDITSLISKNSVAFNHSGFQLIYFDVDDDYQINLFIDALLLDQQKQANKDIIWVSALGNLNATNQLNKKANLFIFPSSNISKVRTLTSSMDIQPTLMEHWLKCPIAADSFGVGANALALPENRVIANTQDNNIIIFDKDKSVLVDQQGNFTTYSMELKTEISSNKDYPLLINGMQYIKKFAQQKSE